MMLSTSPFGFQELPASEKTAAVRGVFAKVAGRYDLMNDVMSSGWQHVWKHHLVQSIQLFNGIRLLDVAGGTGHISRLLQQRLGALSMTGDLQVVDASIDMMRVGRDRFFDHGWPQPTAWVQAVAESLPYPDASVDAYVIAFGLRNVTDLAQSLAEARRVLKPGGRFYCLEFSRPTNPILTRAYDAYSFGIIPRLGKLVTGDAASYRYLVESIRRFPTQQDLAERMQGAGFAQVDWVNYSGGIVALHRGVAG
ncbi:MAG: class I SAM-dependent methyltransferase [Alphaproteobacteria bacterium]|nr:class I SAM-dependent methyltransferase [Alphaproteobacteria bacterium]